MSADERTDGAGLDVVIDPARCSGSGNCGYWAPEVLDLGEDGIAVVIGDPSAHAERVRLAAQHCPTSAITVRDRPTGG